MFATLLSLGLLLSPATPPTQPPLVVGSDDDKHGKHGQDKEDRKEWKHRDKDEEKYWKHERKWEKHQFHGEHDEDQGWDFDHPRHSHAAPPWMNPWWRQDEPHYAALVPGDPSRVYVFIGGRWMLRRVYDPRFRADISGAYSLPMAPPPVPPPHVGLNLHVVLFN